MIRNGGGKCSGMTVTVSCTSTSLKSCDGTKGACRNISTQMLKSVMELRKSRKCCEKGSVLLRVKQGHPYISACWS